MSMRYFLEEVKKAVTGKTFKKKKKVSQRKTAEEICMEELYGQ